MTLPKQYAWLSDEPGPRLLTEFLKVLGTSETPGRGNNPSIMSWARAVGLERIYKADSVPWCGLAMAYVAGQAGWDNAPRGNALAARNWAVWGNPSPVPELGNVLVFSRKGGGHVGVYVAEDDTAFHVLGGNQGDTVSIKRVAKARMIAARECPWRINKPANIRRIRMTAGGPLSINEA